LLPEAEVPTVVLLKFKVFWSVGQYLSTVLRIVVASSTLHKIRAESVN